MNEYVSLVIVSHSEKIAAGVKEMIHQTTRDVIVEVAGGTEDEPSIGTSVVKITEAIERATSPEGILLFYDVGSAKMNAQFVLETIVDSKVEIVDAPLVEGAYIAAVKSSIGKSLVEIKETLHTFFPQGPTL